MAMDVSKMLEIMTAVQSGKMSIQDAMKAAEQAKSALFCKVSELGAVSVYGLNAQFPVTLYRSQWERLADFIPQIQEFIGKNASALSTGKDDPRYAARAKEKREERKAGKQGRQPASAQTESAADEKAAADKAAAMAALAAALAAK